jgi:hypothetical protein
MESLRASVLAALVVLGTVAAGVPTTASGQATPAGPHGPAVQQAAASPAGPSPQQASGDVGTIAWEKRYDEDAEVRAVEQTGDGGYVLVGTVETDGGDDDALVVKVDGEGGIEWKRTLGGGGRDVANDVVTDDGGGYVFVGGTVDSRGSQTAWIVRLSVTGNVIVNRTVSSASAVEAMAVTPMASGDYAITGKRSTLGALLVRTSRDGRVRVARGVGRSNDVGTDIEQLPTGGFAIAGTRTDGAGTDAVFLKTDRSGSPVASETYGGAGFDSVSTMVPVGSGYALAGTEATDGDSDAWLVRINRFGSVQYTRQYGGDGYDTATGLLETDGGFAVGGWTDSFGVGGRDAFVIETDGQGRETARQAFGGAGDDFGLALGDASPDEYVLGGSRTTGGTTNAWLLRVGGASAGAAFEVTDLDAPSTVTPGRTVSVAATVRNVGGSEGTATVAFRVDSDRDGSLSDETAREGTVTVAPGGEGTVTFDLDVPADASAGTLRFDASVDDSTADGRVTVDTAGSDAVSVRLEPSDVTVESGDNRTFDVVATGVTSGVGSFDVTVRSGDTGVATVTDMAPAGDPGIDTVTLADDGSSARLQVAAAALGSGEVRLATVTVAGEGAGTAVLPLSVRSMSDTNGDEYPIEGTTGAEFTVESSGGEGATARLEPADARVAPGENRTVDVVVEGTPDGVGAYDVTVATSSTGTVSIEDVTLRGDPGFPAREVADDGSFARAQAAATSFDSTDPVAVATVTVRGVAAGNASLSLSVGDLARPSGAPYQVGTVTGASVRVAETGTGPSPIDGVTPTDPDGDGLYEDLNGDGRASVTDVQRLFALLDADAITASPRFYDVNGDGRVSVSDVQALFVEVTAA